LIDADSQGNCGTTFNLPAANGLYQVIVDGKAVQDVIQQVPPGTYAGDAPQSVGDLYLLPASARTFEIPFHSNDPFVLLNVVSDMTHIFGLDYIVIDTNPTLTGFDSAIGMASDSYIYVTEAERMSLEGVVNSIEQMLVIASNRQRHLQRDTQLLGILPNKVRQRTAAHQLVLDELADRYPGKVWDPVPLAVVWAEANIMGQLVYNYAQGSAAHLHAERVVNLVLEGLGQWLKSSI